MRRLKLTISYDGTDFAGWQVQSGQRTVQGDLEAAILSVTGETVRATGSGRTDSGVHALGQAAAFSTSSQLSAAVMQRAINANLKEDMRVLSVVEAPTDFDPIRDALGKRYRYSIDDGPEPDVFRRRYAWRLWKPLDEAAMDRAAEAFRGTNDFAAMQSTGSERATTIRTVRELLLRRPSPGRLEIEIEADGFLYNMARNMVGTLQEVGRGAKREDWPAEVIQSQDRNQAGQTAPAHGLFLVEVYY